MENRPDLSDDGQVLVRRSRTSQDKSGKPESDAGWEKVFAEAKKLPQYKETLNWQETISIFRTSRADWRKSV